MRTCGNCEDNKDENENNFRLRTYATGRKFYNSICKECERIKARKYAEDHREECKISSKNFRNDNPEYGKNWKNNNRDKTNERERNRRRNDINFKLKKNISRAVGRAIIKNKNSTNKYLPYTVQALKKHLESQFDANMTWNNYGSYWHIDHIIPQSDLPYFSMEDVNFEKCWMLDNLRPLEANQNRLDGATRVRHKK